MNNGTKFDAGKAPWALVPFDATTEVVKVLGAGSAKYGGRNWEKGMDFSRPFSATMRHLTAWWQGEDHDPETGLSHLAHAACNTLFLLAYSLRGVGRDDRPNLVEVEPVEASFTFTIGGVEVPAESVRWSDGDGSWEGPGYDSLED
jgi:hypothetical protein